MRFLPKVLTKPLRWRKPRRIFIESMGDLFHPGVTDDRIAAVFAVMAACPQHTFQVLTKRPERMPRWFNWAADPHVGGALTVGRKLNLAAHFVMRGRAPGGAVIENTANSSWPLPNVWLGTSIEDQAAADNRIPFLLQTPAAVRFVSLEPLIGPMNMSRYLGVVPGHGAGQWLPWTENILRGAGKLLDQVIVGGETGPGSRPMHPDWVGSIRDQCQAAGVPFFFKSWGDWRPGIPSDDVWCHARQHDWGDGHVSYRVGKKRAGRLLDGREWDEFPQEARHAER